MAVYKAVKRIGTGSWDEQRIELGKDTPPGYVDTITTDYEDPFQQGRTIPGVQYEVDWELLKNWIIDYRFELGISLALGSLAALYVREPEKYGPVIIGICHMVGEITKGVGEVIPG